MTCEGCEAEALTSRERVRGFLVDLCRPCVSRSFASAVEAWRREWSEARG